MENDLKGNENCFELAGGSIYRVFELPGVDCTSIVQQTHQYGSSVSQQIER